MSDHERRKQWLESALVMNRLLLADVSRTEALRAVTGRIRDVSGADYVTVLSVDPDYPEDTTVVEFVDGLGLEHIIGLPVRLQGLTREVTISRRTVVSRQIQLEPGFDPPTEFAEGLSVLGLGMYIPLVASGKVLGVVVAGWRRGSPYAAEAANEVNLLEMFAAHAALALQQVGMRQMIIRDRDRIADALRDAVIDRLFTIGMHLHGVAGLVREEEVQRRLSVAIDELDETTREIRSAIFALHHEAGDTEQSVSEQVLDEIDSARVMLGFTPRLVVHGVVDHQLPTALRRELVRAVRDGLAIAAAHTAPSMVEVVVQVTADDLTLTVTDDGCPHRSSPEVALSQLRARAQQLGGSCHLVRDDRRHTVLEWHVPLAA